MKRKPTHAGCVLREDYLNPLKISVTGMASKSGVSRKTLQGLFGVQKVMKQQQKV
jgi:plasmid maintenance system antidote protein VapI